LTRGSAFARRRTAAASWSGPLHILVCNAGIMAVPGLTRTGQGHELQFAINYLGHFAQAAGPPGARGGRPGADRLTELQRAPAQPGRLR
jgi:NAD(P)-dependent dehydrogenase (short-subunit alcohol dehydrogenase family)